MTSEKKETIQKIASDLYLLCEKISREDQFVINFFGQEYNARIFALELFAYYGFMIDVLCFMKGVSNDNRAQLSSSIESGVIMGWVLLTNDRNITPALKFLKHRDGMYATWVGSDDEWLPKTMRCLVDNLLVSMSGTNPHTNPGMPLVNDPFKALGLFEYLAKDFAAAGKIVNLKLINSLSLLIANMEKT